MNQPNARSVCSRGVLRPRADIRLGLTLIELIITLAVLAVLAAMIIPHIGTQVPEQLEAVAEIVAADLEYARSLAVANNSSYRITLEPAADSYYLQHSGANTLLSVLPPSAFRQNDDPVDRQTTRLANLPLAQPHVRLEAVVTDGAPVTSVADVEFTSLGGTSRAEDTVIWLGCSSGADERFISVHVRAATGLVEVGELETELPADVAGLAE